MWVRGQWRKRYGSDMSILLYTHVFSQTCFEWILGGGEGVWMVMCGVYDTCNVK